MQELLEDYLTLKLTRLQCSEGWAPGKEGLSFVLVKGGKGRYLLGKSNWNLNCGDVLVQDLAAGGKLTAQNSEMLFWHFSLRFEHLFPLFSTGEICLLQSITQTFRHSKMYLAPNPLAKECHALVEGAPPQGNVDHRSQMLRVAAAVLSAEFMNARNQRTGLTRVEDRMVRVFESLSTNDLLALSVGDLAKKFNCSRRHLNRLFHQHLGFSVAALRMEMRLLKAVSLLRDSDLKVITVAEQCGFSHLGLFNTCFKRRFGTSPGKWRKNSATIRLYLEHSTDSGVSGSSMESQSNGNGDSSQASSIQRRVFKVLHRPRPGTGIGAGFHGLPANMVVAAPANLAGRPSL